MPNEARALGANGAEGSQQSCLHDGVVAEREVSAVRSGQVWAVPVREARDAPYGAAEVFYRCFELVAATLGLIVGAPLILIGSILICLDSPGSPMYVHRRPGQSKVMRGRDLMGRADLRAPPGGFDPDALYYVPSYFKLYKLRTMYSDSRSRFPQLYAYDYTSETFRFGLPTLRDDPRVTRVGAILRKTSIDELPNLWSVLTGDLRLVGPRPEAPEVLRYYAPEEMYKFSCKPGITGLAQISGRGLLNWGETIDWDLRYVRDRNVALDLKILFQTMISVIRRHGAF